MNVAEITRTTRNNIEYFRVPDLTRYFGFAHTSCIDNALRKGNIKTIKIQDQPNSGFVRYISTDNLRKLKEYYAAAKPYAALRIAELLGENLQEVQFDNRVTKEIEIVNTDNKVSDMVQSFINQKFGTLRIVVIEDRVWFVGKDVAAALGYSNASKAVINHVDSEDRRKIMIDFGASSQNGNVPTGQTQTTVINESGLYSLILSSKLPSAKDFKRWVTSEVLPSIRKHGGYVAGQENLDMTTEEFLAKAVLMSDSVIKEREARIKELELENENLITGFKALSREINTWEPRTVINACIRSAANTYPFNGDFKYAYNTYFKQLRNVAHIDLKNRKNGESRFDAIRDDEWDICVQVALAFCESHVSDVQKVINEINYEVYKGAAR